MSFAIQAKGLEYLAKTAGTLEKRLYAVPREIDEQVARIKLDALAVSIGQHNLYSKAATFDLSLYVDGLFVARQVVTAPYGTRTDAFFDQDYLPFTRPYLERESRESAIIV
mgnify:CR=1 FL=1